MSDQAPKPLPCPFCNDPMKSDADGVFQHVEQTDGCPIRQNGFIDIAGWNRRAQVEAMVEALNQIIEQDDAGDLLYRADGPCARIAREVLERLNIKPADPVVRRGS